MNLDTLNYLHSTFSYVMLLVFDILYLILYLNLHSLLHYEMLFTFNIIYINFTIYIHLYVS